MHFLVTIFASLFVASTFGSCQNITSTPLSLYVEYCVPPSIYPVSSILWTVISFPNEQVQQFTDNKLAISHQSNSTIDFYYIRCDNHHHFVKENVVFINSKKDGVILWLDEDDRVIPRVNGAMINLTKAIFPFQLRAKVFGCDKDVLAIIKSPPLNASLINSFPGNVIEFFQVNYGTYFLSIQCSGQFNKTVLATSAMVSGPTRATGNQCHCIHNGVCSLIQNSENNQTCYCSEQYTGSKCQWKVTTSQQVAITSTSFPTATATTSSGPVTLSMTVVIIIHVGLAVLDCLFLLTFGIIYYKKNFPRGSFVIRRLDSAVYTPISTQENRPIPKSLEDLENELNNDKQEAKDEKTAE